MPTIKAADTDLFYCDWGDGKPVLFCSGRGLSSIQWQYQMVSLSAAGFRAIAYDRRGHGRSDDPGSGFDYDTLAEDLAAVIERHDLVDLTLVGHSMGGGEIVRYLTRHGTDRVSGVFLIGTTLPFSEQQDDNPTGIPSEMLEAVRREWFENFGSWIDENEAGYFGDGLVGCEVGPALREWTRSDLLRTSLHALIEFNREGAATDFREELRRLDLPVRLVHGDHDASTPLELSARPASALLPNSTLTVYEDAPHGLYLTHRARLNEELLTFVSTRQPMTSTSR